MNTKLPFGLKHHHFFFLGAGIVTLSLGFFILWQNIIVTGPATIGVNSCSSAYTILLRTSRGQSADPTVTTNIKISANDGTNDGSFSGKVTFYRDNLCTSPISTITLPAHSSQSTFYIKYQDSQTTLKKFRVVAEASRFWSGSFDVSAGTSFQQKTTKFGIHVSVSGTTDDVVNFTKSFGAELARINIQMETWNGTATEYNKYIAAGFKPLLNITWKSSASAAAPFPTALDLATYTTKLSSILNSIAPPEVVVIENEEINGNFHTGPMSDYIGEVAAAAPIVHAKGLKLTNGGVYGNGLDTLIYRYLANRYGTAFADTNFGNYMFLPATLNAIKNGTNSGIESAATEVQTDLAGIAPYVDYINVHRYEVENPNVSTVNATTVTQNVLKYTREYVETTYGKPIMSNETSIRSNNQPSLVTSYLQDFVNAGYPYVLWWDNSDGNKYYDCPLNDSTSPYNYRSNGVAFRNFMSGYYGSVSAYTGVVSSTTCSFVSTVPVITSALSASATVGSAFSYTITATNTPNQFSATNLPPGLTISNSGVISGKPGTAGTYTTLIVARNGAGGDAKTLTITVTSTSNNPPSANAGADQSITTSMTTLSGSGSDSDGSIVAYAWSEVSGPNTATIASNANASTGISGLVSGTYVFRLTVTDNKGGIGSDTVQVTVALANGGIVNIKWGGNWQGQTAASQVTLDRLSGIVYQRSSLALPAFSGKRSDLETFIAAGIKPIVNVTWSATPTPKAYPHTTADLDTFKSQLDYFLSVYHPEIIVVENEETNLNYFPESDVTTLHYYVDEVKAAIAVAHAHGVKVADGGLHVDVLNQIMNGNIKAGSPMERQKYLLDQFKTIPDLDYVNMHMAACTPGLGDANGFPQTLLRDVGNWASSYVGGKSMISNEWHTECDSTVLVNDVVDAFKFANTANPKLFKDLSMMFSGDGTHDAFPFNAGSALNTLGSAYSSELQAPYP